ncbi:hypothetical protein E4T39_06469 [Aureobasidium subglaciale]|nr:hypothetical protein E4T39_06469 [Aureobasidium subglaciale]
MSKPILELIETNEAGIVTATYVQTSAAKRDVSRIDRIVIVRRIIIANPTTYVHSGAREHPEITQSTTRRVPTSRIPSFRDRRLFTQLTGRLQQIPNLCTKRCAKYDEKRKPTDPMEIGFTSSVL